MRLGIGIATYNRRAILADTIDKVRRFTRHPDTILTIADDGSTDGAERMLLDGGLPVVGGVNMGVAWNKNRALYLLRQLLGCDIVLLLEDDSPPGRLGWEAEWIDAVERFGHVNFAAPWMRELFVSGAGTAADPIVANAVSAQCAGYSRAALDYGGYFDSRFRGFGHEHVEHTARLIRIGFGGAELERDGESRIVFNLIEGGIAPVEAPSHSTPEAVERNWLVAAELMADQTYRAPWRDRAELRQFRAEMESAMDRHPTGYRLDPGK